MNAPQPRLLAFDTSTDALSVGVRHGERYWLHGGPGAARSSGTLIPVALDLLSQAGLGLRELDAIVFGRGPGSFTGLRTACAVAQGLAAGSGRQVLGIDTLLAVAEQARHEAMADDAATAQPLRVSAVLDARMDEVYLQHFEWAQGQWHSLGPCQLCAPESLQLGAHAPQLVAGNAGSVYGDRLPGLPPGSRWVTALPTAEALLRLAPALMQGATPPAQALPLYVRDKVAQTTEERLAARQAKLQAEAGAAAGPRSQHP